MSYAGKKWCLRPELHWDFLLRTEVSWLVGRRWQDWGDQRDLRPSFEFHRLACSAAYTLATMKMDLPSGAAPLAPRYKGGMIAGSWEN